MSSAFLWWTTSCRGLLRGLGGLRGGNESAFGGCHDLSEGKMSSRSEVEKIRFTLILAWVIQMTWKSFFRG